MPLVPVIDIDRSPGVGRIRLASTQDIATAEQANTKLWVLGHPHGHSQTIDVEALLESYLRNGPKGIFSSPGSFFVVIRDDDKGKLIMATDRLAGWPTYARWTGERVVSLATSLREGVRAGLFPRRLDPDGLREVLTLARSLGDRTPVQDVRRIGPAEVTVMSRGGVERTRWWRAEDRVASASGRLRSRRDELVARLQTALERALGEARHAHTTLSGGLDSRVLLAAIIRSRRAATGHTIAVPEGRDERYAARCCELVGAQHHLVRLDRDYSTDTILEAASECLDGMCLVDSVPVLLLVDSLGDSPPPTMLHGALGEVMKLQNAHELAQRARFSHSGNLSAHLVGKFAWSQRLLDPVLSDRFKKTADPCDSLYEHSRRVCSDLSRLEAATVMYLSLFFHAYAALGARLYGSIACAFPFADGHYLDEALDVVPEDRLHTAFHVHALRALEPRLLRVPDSNSGISSRAPRLVSQASVIATKVLSRLKVKRAAGHDAYASAMGRRSAGMRNKLKTGHLVQLGLIDREGLKGLEQACAAGSEPAAAVLQRLHLLDLWASALSLE